MREVERVPGRRGGVPNGAPSGRCATIPAFQLSYVPHALADLATVATYECHCGVERAERPLRAYCFADILVMVAERVILIA
jgi:hypothetical protein